MREMILIYGKTGTGKSTIAKEIIKTYNRVVIIDPKHEYDGLIFTSFEDMLDFHKDNTPATFIYVCRFESDIEHDFTFRFCQAIENVLLVVEEIEIYISPYSKSSYFLNLCRYGRHHDVSILGIARRAAEVSIDFRALVTQIISFKQTEPNDLKLMEKLGLYNLEKLTEHEHVKVIP